MTPEPSPLRTVWEAFYQRALPDGTAAGWYWTRSGDYAQAHGPFPTLKAAQSAARAYCS